MEAHDIAKLFPEMTGTEFESLVESIRANGLRESIWLHPDGRIVDGRNRYRACRIAGIEPHFRTYNGEDGDALLRLVLDLNLERRHLNESQRAMVAARLATMKHGGDRRSDQAANLPDVRQSQAASMLNIAERSIRSAKAIHEQGTQELVAVVESGTVPVSVAEKVARMPEAAQERFISEATTSAKPPHQIVAAMKREEKRAEIIREAALGAIPVGKKYPVVYADPPWRYEQQLMGHTDRGVENHYPTMPLEDICALPVSELAAADAVLFLWATVPCLLEALAVMKAWGFAYKSHFVWVKDRIGLGFHNRNQHELLLIGRRGNIPLAEPELRPSSVVNAPIGRHSEKPCEFSQLIDLMYPDYPRIELFSRLRREGWDAWGYEAEAGVSVEALT